MRLGATTEEWAHFASVSGLRNRLLPVVSNPGARISPASAIKAPGKTPSVYNANREVAGLPKWTERGAPSEGELRRWQKEDDYGLCVRTGALPGGTDDQILAIDIDVDDAEAAGRIEQLLSDALGVALPCRVREGSGKRLLVLRVAGAPVYKRICRTAHGLVELLATGQQFVAAGTHPSGARYAWRDGLPGGAPAVDREDLDAVWRDFCAIAAVAPPVDASARRRGETVDADDDRLDWLEANWENHGYGREGDLRIVCPWKDGHSGDSGESETVYFPAGTGGYEQGHYKCLHASCAHRTDNDFDAATGYAASALVDLTEALADGEETLPTVAPKGLTVAAKGAHKGRYEASLPNLVRVLDGPEWLGWDVAFDTFTAGVVMSPHGKDAWRPFTDTDYTRVRLWLEERRFAPIGRELIRDAIHFVAERRQFDSAQIWLSGLEWDGVPRVDTFLTRYFGAEASDYARAVSRYWWTAHAGRVVEPGCQCDMVPILVGEQGAGKSQAVKAMVPDPERYIEVNLEHKDADLSRKMRGALIGELGELRGLQGRSAEANKAWVTSQTEEWTPKFMEYTSRLRRRLVFVGTTNRDDFLGDDTGERRWLPIRVGATDIAGIERDRLQLWAEARALFGRFGVLWKDAYELAKARHEEFKAHDIWEAPVAHLLKKKGDTPVHKGDTEEFIKLEDVFFYAFAKSAREVTRSDELRMGRVLRALGFMKAERRVSGEKSKVWVRPCRPVALLEGDMGDTWATEKGSKING